jgi:23S rRNA (cytosine1962-C5)-methyltransferase
VTTITLKKGKLQAIWAGHPWVFAQGIANVQGAPSAGDPVVVEDPEGRFIGRGFWSPNSAIPVRIASRDPAEQLDSAWLGRAFDRAAALRKQFELPSGATTGYRLIHSEGDGLPGLVVDVLGQTASVQLLTLGMKLREQEIYGHIARITGAKTIVEIASERAQEREGFTATTGIVRGIEPSSISFFERGMGFELDPKVSQKTGFYFDQRENRAWVEKLAHGRRVLDLYCFVGSFSLFAARGGAEHVVAVDSSPVAIAMAASNAHRIGVADRITFERADCRVRMQELIAKKEKFDLVVLDPPKLAPSIKNLERARSAYRKLNADAARLVERGGILVSCSCSAAMTHDDLLRTAAMGASDAKRELTLLHSGQQGPDHPAPAAFSEGRYLKALFFRVL